MSTYIYIYIFFFETQPVYWQNAAADSLSKFYYPPVAAVSVSYPKEAIRKECLIDGELKGFGQLHPRSQGVETLGIFCYLSFSSLLPMLEHVSSGHMHSSPTFSDTYVCLKYTDIAFDTVFTACTISIY